MTFYIFNYNNYSFPAESPLSTRRSSPTPTLMYNDRIQLAIDCLKEGQTFIVEGLKFELEEKNFIVIGWSEYLNLSSLTKETSLEELNRVKTLFSDMVDSSLAFEKFMIDKTIEYRLYYDDAGKASIPICSEKHNVISWNVNLE